MRTTHVTLGELRCHVVDAGGGDGSRDRAPDLVVVLCHGFGAPGDDLVGLAHALVARVDRPDRRLRLVFPEAPLEPPELAAFGGRAWWRIDVERYVRLAARGTLREACAETPEGLGPARRLLRAAVEAALAQSGVEASRLVLGGFSQGAMIATDLCLRLEERPAGLLAFSGAPIYEAEWVRLAARRAGLPAVVSHGDADAVLWPQLGEWLRDLLRDGGLDVRWVPFAGGHTIDPAGLVAAAELLRERL